MTEPDRERQVCPRCHLPSVPIMYGYPSPSGSELTHIGRTVGGGCLVEPDMPTWSCPRRHRFRPSGTPAVPDDFAAARLYLAGDLAGAELAYRDAARASAESRGETHPETLLLRHALAIVLYSAGRLADGEAEYRAMRAASGHPLTAGAIPTLDELRAIINRRYEVP